MARDRANIRTDIWADADWRQLTLECQHLYVLLLTHPTLNYAGVADWRPGRIAALAANVTADSIRTAATELQARGFILADDNTEEVLVRSFVKHDGLMKQPKLAVAMANAYAGVASAEIRSVIAFEVQKLKERMPELAAWGAKQVQTVLAAEGVPIEDVTPAFTPGFTPPLTPAVTPNGDQAQPLPTTTATTTATRTSSPASAVSESDFEKAYSHWPKKTDRKKSFEKFKRVAAVRGLETITADVIRFGDAYARTTERQYVPALVVWLNGERWTDELPGTPGRPFAAVTEDIRGGFLFRQGKPVIGGPNGMNRDQYEAWVEAQKKGPNV